MKLTKKDINKITKTNFFKLFSSIIINWNKRIEIEKVSESNAKQGKEKYKRIEILTRLNKIQKIK